MKFKFLLLLGCLAFCGQMLYAQIDTLREQGKGSNHQPGNIQGLVFDADTQTPIAGATVKLLSDGRTTSTDAQGQFRIPVVSPGSHFLQISYVGYEQITELPVSVLPSQTSEISSSLLKSGNHIDEVLITSNGGGRGEDRLIRERQAAMMAQVQIGAQELSRKGISDASDAVAQLAGISQQEGRKIIYIRGLGDRYRTTSLNDLPLPSDDPEHKNPSLTLFSTDVVDAIEVDKTYHSALSGDFGGGHVRIQSKKFPGQNYWNLSLSSEQAFNAISHTAHFPTPAWASTFGSKHVVPQDPFQAFQFGTGSNKHTRYLPVGLRLTGAQQWVFDGGARLQFFGTGSLSNAFSYQKGRARNVNAQGVRILDLNKEQFAYETSGSGLLNLSYLKPDGNQFHYHLLYTQMTESKNEQYLGYIRDLAEEEQGRIQRGTFSANHLLVHQLRGAHPLSTRWTTNWGVSAAHMNSELPNRTQYKTRFLEAKQQHVVAQNTDTDNHRYFQNLGEEDWAWQGQATYTIDEWLPFPGQVKVGYQGRWTDRVFEAIQFNFRVRNPGEQVVHPDRMDDFFNQDQFSQGKFSIGSYAGNTPQTYTGEQRLHAGYLQFFGEFSEKWHLLVGLRAEQISQAVSWQTQLSAQPGEHNLEKSAFLPHIQLKYRWKEQQQFRYSASKTYTLPQFKERAVFVYEDVTEKKIGNPHLYASDNYHADLSWEWYPRAGEILAVTAFGKYLKNPINETTIASSTNDISTVNTGDFGFALGAEIEVRLQLSEWSGPSGSKQGLTWAGNLTYMHSDQELSKEKVLRETDFALNLTQERAPFTGASKYLANTDISYTYKGGGGLSLTGTWQVNYTSRSIYALGTEGKGNLVNKGLTGMDVIVKGKIRRGLGLDLGVKNLLDPTVQRVQEHATGDLPVDSFKRGRILYLGINYTF